MNCPFAAHNTASDPHSLNNNHRLKLYRRFIGRDLAHVYAIDIGAHNYIGESLCVSKFTAGNLNDFGWHTDDRLGMEDANVITCFEVVQHVMNPLDLVRRCWGRLKSGGRLYIATPKQWLIPWYHGTENFVEYKPEHLEQMFRYVGFDIIRRETHNPWPLRFMFYGVRPFFRVLLNRFVIWELRKP